ncbi:hypothetical protein OQX61_01880 [Pedobacter sp. PLR]|uniref:hypothetical protein n=1 Tax=Pedobacter sp. PLR TaxID=2994465 RepID=UPI0022464B20|nr:hypothetical protein [Pedobacter sp. PLR]MCX2450008.1 hypothetical protein [Pedobacter sp. PLR]
MKKHTLYILSCTFLVFGCYAKGKAQHQELAAQILADSSLTIVDNLAKSIIKEGFNAGSGYSQIWARDFNTLIETSLAVRSKEDVRGAILMFFALQQKNDEMVDGYVVKKDFTWNDDTPYYSEAAPGHVGFKNTVETDQETSLIQLVGKYIQKTGDVELLNEKVAGVTVLARMEKMIDYLLRERYNKKYGLLWGAMTADWGDVQPNDTFGCDWNELSNEAIDVYDNAMFMIALQYLVEIVPDQQKVAQWTKLKKGIHDKVRQHLWDTKNQKFIPHIYPGKSPIPAGFDENKIHYHGGTAVAIEAGLLSKKEIATVNRQMVENVKLSGMPSIGLTLYPTYPDGFFKGGMSKPYVYQNGGDWTWFGGRMIQQLIANGFVKEAYEEVRPMINRVVKNQGFYEWYGKGDVPDGSGKFKGSAGVLSKAILQFRVWAEANQKQTK